MEKANELKAQLYIEGRSVPFVSATTTFAEGQPATANISLVPLVEINDILPRTMVHLFVKDFNHPKKPWVILFEGEVYGYGFGKSTQDRSFTIFCMDVSNYWDNAKQFYLNQKTSMGDANNIIVSNAAAAQARKENTQVITTIAGIKPYLISLMTEAINSGKDLVEACVKALKGVEEVNPFFRFGNTRYRINDRMLFQSSRAIKSLFNFEQAEAMYEAICGQGNGGLVSMRSVIQMMLELVFHDFVSIGAPSKTSSIKSGIGPKGTQTVGTFLFKPDTFMLAPPKCNVIFPDQYNQFNFTRQFFHEVTRLKFQPRMITAQVVASGSDAGVAQALQPFYYAPAGYNQYRTTNPGETGGTQFENAGTSGAWGDDASKVVKTATKLQDYHFLSYEEVIKGIFGDMDNAVPCAAALAKIQPYGDQTKFYQRAADYLFYKKRYAARTARASGPLNISPVPGLPMVIVDNSAAEQHVVGVLSSITHQIHSTMGASTSYEIGYARYVEEKDLWDGSLMEPPIPPWFDPAIYGSLRRVNSKDYQNLATDEEKKRVKKLKFVNDFGNTTIKDFYAEMLGGTKAETHTGAEPITDTKFPNVVSAVLNLVRQYRAAKQSDRLHSFLSTYGRRDYVELTEMFSFLGAEIPDYMKNASTEDKADVIFSGDVFDGGFVNKATNTNRRDAELKNLFGDEATSRRRAPIDAYRQRLFKERGFRG